MWRLRAKLWRVGGVHGVWRTPETLAASARALSPKLQPEGFLALNQTFIEVVEYNFWLRNAIRDRSQRRKSVV
jgi:hypothetical protein